jgi:hypothetical protein
MSHFSPESSLFLDFHDFPELALGLVVGLALDDPALGVDVEDQVA